MLDGLNGAQVMKIFARIGLALLLLSASRAVGAAQSSGDDPYQEWVDYRNGEVSLAFNQTPLPFALYAIEAKTGFQIVVPSNSEVKLVDLKLERQPFEPAMRALISTMGYNNFALLYDQDGRPHRAVVLGVGYADAKNAAPAQKKEAAVEPLTAQEKEKLQKDLQRWAELNQEERGRIEGRLKTLPPSDEREELVKEYGRQVLAVRQ